MRKLRHHQVLALLLVAACGGESTVVQVDVASVTVSPSPASVEVGLTVQFTASAVDDGGNPVSGQDVTWESSTPAVASIDDDGVATGLVAGTTQISATVGGVTGEQTLTVEAPSCTALTDVVLAPGEYVSLPGNECLRLPAGSAGDMYRVALARPTVIENATNTPTVSLSIATIAAAVGPVVEAPAADRPSPALPREQLPTIDATRTLRHLRWMDATRAFHNELRLRERSLGLGRSGLLASAARVGAAAPVPADPPATDSMFLQLDCTDATPRQPVTLISFSDHIAVYQETARYDTDPISADAANELIAYYDAYVRGMAVDYWGPLPDTDADGRVIVVTTPNLDESAAAAVYSGDFYQVIGPPGESCQSSNEGETIYFQTDFLRYLDPAADTLDYFALGVVAHETKHVVSLYNGIQRGALNELWIEEGTAEISQEMASRYAWAANGGPPVGEQITGLEIYQAATSPTLQREITGLVDVLASTVRSLSAQPNSVIVDPDGAPDTHSFYGSSFHWHRFVGDAYGDASEAMDSAFFRALIDPGTSAGAASGEVALSGRGSFEQIFEDFVVAVSLHGTGYPTPFPIDTWDFVTAASIFSNPNPPGDYPWPATATESQQWAPFATATYTGRIGPSGVRFHDFRSGGTADVQISVSGPWEQPCDDDNTMRCDRIIVTRLD